jgi:hypothetical protein
VKKLLISALALVLLCGCSAVEPAHSPEPTAAETPAAVADDYGRPGPVELPELGFEPEGLYLAEGFGAGGYALLLTGAAVEGQALDFAVFMGQRWEDCAQTGRIPQSVDAWSCTGCGTLSGGVCEFTADTGWAELTGRLTFGDDTVNIEYITASAEEYDLSDADGPSLRFEEASVPDFAHRIRLPAEFTARPLEELGELWCGLPFFECETRLPLPLRGELGLLRELLGEPDSYDEDELGWDLRCGDTELYGYFCKLEDGSKGYYLMHLSTRDAALAPLVRGITIGCSADEVLSRFPNDAGSYADILEAYEDYEFVFYGGGNLPDDYGTFRKCTEGDKTYAFGYIQVFESGRFVKFFLDESGVVTEISWSEVN